MKKKKSIWKIMVLFVLAVTILWGVQEVVQKPIWIQAAPTKNGWVKTGSNNWYYYQKGSKVKNQWIFYKNQWYFLNSGSGAMAKSTFINWKSKKYYVDQTGVMVTGWKRLSGKWYYFEKSGGAMRTGWLNLPTGKYCLTKSGRMYTRGWHTIGGRRYYMKESGAVHTGWLELGGKKYYLRKSGSYKGSAAVGTYIMGKYRRTFNASGILVKSEPFVPKDKKNTLQKSTGTRTLRNYLLEALRPVGTTNYVLGGGWDPVTATSKTIPKSLDCSGFVGWASYQIMNKKAGNGNGYVVKSTIMASEYAKWGWGSKRSHSQLQKNGFKGQFKAADIVSREGHVWLVIGQCSDGSYVLVHSSPPCTQIAGTPTPDNRADSEAILLAQKYMKKYYQSTLDKYKIPQMNTWATDRDGYMYNKSVYSFRWSNAVLSDPDGFGKKDAAVILRSLYGEV